MRTTSSMHNVLSSIFKYDGVMEKICIPDRGDDRPLYEPSAGCLTPLIAAQVHLMVPSRQAVVEVAPSLLEVEMDYQAAVVAANNVAG
jgi:hypothetical protein